MSLRSQLNVLVARDGTIRGADVDPDYTIRPEPSRTVEGLRTLQKAK